MHAKLVYVMGAVNRNLNNIVAAILAIVMYSIPCQAADEVRLDQLFAELKEADSAQAVKIAKEIDLEFSKSGSPAMDLLLKRGTDALKTGEIQAAIGHLTALTDHAPDFAEGWHARSAAYVQAGLYGPALSDLERALALRPRNFNAIFGLGVVLEELNQPELAHEAYNQVLTIHPHHQAVGEALERLEPQIGGEQL